jgi:hypothetical protein
MRELLRAKSAIDYTSRGAVDRPNRATFKPLSTCSLPGILLLLWVVESHTVAATSERE